MTESSNFSTTDQVSDVPGTKVIINEDNYFLLNFQSFMKLNYYGILLKSEMHHRPQISVFHFCSSLIGCASQLVNKAVRLLIAVVVVSLGMVAMGVVYWLELK